MGAHLSIDSAPIAEPKPRSTRAGFVKQKRKAAASILDSIVNQKPSAEQWQMEILHFLRGLSSKLKGAKRIKTITRSEEDHIELSLREVSSITAALDQLGQRSPVEDWSTPEPDTVYAVPHSLARK